VAATRRTTPTPIAPDDGVARSIWNGALSFAGIDVPVKVFGAADPQGVQFRELHEPDGEEIDTERAQAPEPSDDLMAALEASLKGCKR
jgi:non-homologous end joining protein Ku